VSIASNVGACDDDPKGECKARIAPLSNKLMTQHKLGFLFVSRNLKSIIGQ